MALGFDVGAFRPHALHDAARDWPQTNCAVDLWIELLHVHGCDPLAALACTSAIDFEGDQFTFFKLPFADLEQLYGVDVQELNIFGSLADHVAVQAARGVPVLVEVDGHFLPDTAATTYRRSHGKTTIGVLAFDRPGRRVGYLHNDGYYAATDDDFDGLFGLGAHHPALLPPYVEFVRLERLRHLSPPALRAASLETLTRHAARRPTVSPIARYAAWLPEALTSLRGEPLERFHLHAFATLRQLGANFELLGSYLTWLAAGPPDVRADAVAACQAVSSTAKTLQFTLARIASGRAMDPTNLLHALENSWERVQAGVDGVLAG